MKALINLARKMVAEHDAYYRLMVPYASSPRVAEYRTFTKAAAAAREAWVESDPTARTFSAWVSDSDNDYDHALRGPEIKKLFEHIANTDYENEGSDVAVSPADRPEAERILAEHGLMGEFAFRPDYAHPVEFANWPGAIRFLSPTCNPEVG